ncbi:MAG: ABC transporter permease [Candidatus Sulfopaludibacter sp.]|nr:ABC transporter permease [Candidatus Sulfopaludibacter sp.]
MTARLREWCLRLRGTFTNRHAGMEEELRFHLEMAEEEALRRGVPVRGARVQAGGLAQASEAVREQGAIGWLGDLMRDSRHAARSLKKNPLFAAAAIVSLALGIGANTAIFGVVNAAFLRPLPYPAPGRIVWVTEQDARSHHSSVMMPEYAAWKLHNGSFERLSAYQRAFGANLLAPSQAAERVQADHVTPDFFAMLGVAPRIGRDFQPGESEPGRNNVALIADSLWRNYLHARADAVGMSLLLDGAPKTVIGVMPPDFVYPEADRAVLWLPDAVDARGSVPSHSRRDVSVIGRLKPGATVEQARADLEVIARSMDGQYPEPFLSIHRALSVRVRPLQDQLAGGSRIAIYVLMGAVGCMLLIVCANVANLFLARSVAREREIALRVAMGASRSRVVRLLLAESLLLGAAGGLQGILLARGTASALGFLLPETIPHPIPLDPRVLGFAAICSLGSGILFGLAPSVIASRLDLNSALKEGGAHRLYRKGRLRLRGSLAIAQLALCLVLLVGSGLLLRSFVSLLSVRLGFDARNVLVADIWLTPPNLYGPARQIDFFRRALAAVKALPGVQFAAVASEPPLGASVISPRAGLRGEGEAATRDVVYITAVSTDYFRALRIPLLAGRPFQESDRDGARGVAIISQSAARLLFKDRNPMGQRVLYPKPEFDPGGKIRFDETNWLTVVGIAADIRHGGLEEPVWPELYQPYEQEPMAQMNLVVRGYSDPSAMARTIRQAVQAIDREQPLFGLETMEALLSDSVAQRRQRAYLLGAFAFVSLIIAMVGVYGVMAYSVTRRTHEIGVRIALGAKPGDVLAMVVGEGLVMALTGIAIGLALSLALTRVLASFLFGVGPRDLATFASISVALVAATCLASYVPARRATRVGPIRALRHE